MLGAGGPLDWSQAETGLTIKTPAQKPGDYAYTFKIGLKGAA
jgi:hypothetical protein